MRQTNNIFLYDKTNIDSLSYPDEEEVRYEYDFFVPFVKNGADSYIKNIKTDMRILKIDDILLPVCIQNFEYENAYTASLFAHYVSYAKEELKELKNPFFEKLLKILLNFLGIIYKMCKIDKVVYVNNRLLSTNLYMNLTFEQYKTVTEFLKDKFPDYAIVFRSLNDNLLKTEIGYLKNIGYKMLGSRQVYIFDSGKRKILKKNFKNKLNKDMKLLKNGNYEIINADCSFVHRIFELYNMLYLDKYSKYNPQFTEEFYKLCIENKLLNFKLLSKNGEINGVLGYYVRNNVMTTPVFGYDTSLPKEECLYRLLSAELIEESEKNGCSVNMSSGASSFKIYRGAVPSLEYSGIYYSNLPLYRRVVYNFLIFLIDKVAIPVLKQQKL